MGQPANEQAMMRMRDFLGQVSNMDPHDLPPGAAQQQVNVTCVKQGQMKVRGGLREVTFEED
jgi:hypothetical protein